MGWRLTQHQLHTGWAEHAAGQRVQFAVLMRMVRRLGRGSCRHRALEERRQYRAAATSSGNRATPGRGGNAYGDVSRSPVRPSQFRRPDKTKPNKNRHSRREGQGVRPRLLPAPASFASRALKEREKAFREKRSTREASAPENGFALPKSGWNRSPRAAIRSNLADAFEPFEPMQLNLVIRVA